MEQQKIKKLKKSETILGILTFLFYIGIIVAAALDIFSTESVERDAFIIVSIVCVLLQFYRVELKAERQALEVKEGLKHKINLLELVIEEQNKKITTNTDIYNSAIEISTSTTQFLNDALTALDKASIMLNQPIKIPTIKEKTLSEVKNLPAERKGKGIEELKDLYEAYLIKYQLREVKEALSKECFAIKAEIDNSDPERVDKIASLNQKIERNLRFINFLDSNELFSVMVHHDFEYDPKYFVFRIYNFKNSGSVGVYYAKSDKLNFLGKWFDNGRSLLSNEVPLSKVTKSK